MVDEDSLREQLDALRKEHQALDDQADQLARVQPVDFLTLSKLKKDRLRIKDTIQRIESMLIPDILA